MNILDKIVVDKRLEVEQRKKIISVSELESSKMFNLPLRSFFEAIRKKGPSVIAEFKRKSPSKGTINLKAQPEDVIKKYEAAGVAAASVLTDSYFDGHCSDLKKAARITNLPVLRKDFIIDEYQIFEARHYGASAILLIAAVLTPDQVRTFSYRAQSLGMDVLFEIREKEELDKLSENIRIIGINNRNLRTFDVDLNQSMKILNDLPDTCLRISESGINQPADVISLFEAGFDGFLLGEIFMRTDDPGIAAGNFMNEIKRLTISDNEN